MRRSNLAGHGILTGHYTARRPLNDGMRAANGDLAISDYVVESEDWRPEGWLKVMPADEVDDNLLVKLAKNVALYHKVRDDISPKNRAVEGMELELDTAFLQIQRKIGEKYFSSVWNRLHQEYRCYEHSAEARMKVGGQRS